MSRLDIIDATFHFASKDVSLDQYVLFAFEFEQGKSPSFDAVSEVLGSRAARISDLRKKIAQVPGNLDYPRWVRADSPMSAHIHEASPNDRSWDGIQHYLVDLLTRPVDATRQAWKVHVVRRVTGVPRAAGEAIVVVFQVSHALTDGKGATRLARALFGDAAPSSPDAPQRTSLLPTAVRSAVALPWRVAASRLGALRARRVYARTRDGGAAGRGTLRPGIRGNADATNRRVVHMITCAPGAFRRSGLSVTTLGLTAVGVATRHFLDGHGEQTPPTLNALVPMAIPDHVDWPAANRVVNGTVDLHPDIDDTVERAEAIRASLSKSRSDVTDPKLIRWISAENMIPAPIYLAVRRRRAKKFTSTPRTPEKVLTNVTVVSVDRGKKDVELLGAPPVLSAGFPMLADGRSVTHGFYGLGDTVTVCVVACPDTFPDHERYAEILEQAVEDVSADTAVTD